MIGKKINQLATELAPVSTDLTIIGDPTTGVSKKITLAQLGAIFSGAVSFYTNLAGFPAIGDINVIYCAKDTQKLYLWSGSAYTEVFPSQALLNTYQLRSEKGVSNGYASLDSGGKVPISQLPSSIMEYKGTWNAATNTPTLANGTGDTGDVYICNVAGTVNFGAGGITFAVGDYVIYSGTIWQRSSGAVGTVTSVAVSRSGDALAITGSPVTTSGTINVGFAGNSTQYINGAGNLVTFPGVINEAQNLITEVYNKTGATLTKGTVVYINGGQGNLPAVTKALATSDSTSAQTYGIVRNDITNNNNGYVVVAGRISDLDTQAYTEGTQLYLSPTTAGTYTSTKQYAPNHLVYVGIVVRAHPTQGVIEVKIQNGYEMDELHNVAAQNPSNGDILQYVSATSLWTKTAGTTTNIAEGSNLYYTDARSRAALSFTAGSGAYNSTTGVITIPTNTNQLTNGANYITLASLSAGAGISYNNTTGVIASTITQYTDANARAAISLTTSGTSGAATYNSTTGVLNVPQYAPDLSGYVPTSRTLTINGTAYDLSANRSWSVGTVTSVGLSSATSGVTIGSTPITTSGTITLAIATASGSQQGLLSSTDWTTFNNKQNALTNPVTGTGTTNYLPKFTGTSTIGNSLVTDNGYYVGFGFSGAGILGGQNLGVDSIGAFQNNLGSYGYRWLVNNGVNELMRLNASGNLGLGVTPSAWASNSTVLQITKGTSIESLNNVFDYTSLNTNLYFNSSRNPIYLGNGYASRYFQYEGSHTWQIAPSGTAGNAISFTQAMTLDASGRLGIGTTSMSNKLEVLGTAASPNLTGTNAYARFYQSGGFANITIGGLASGSYAGWLQSSDGVGTQLPLALQPNGGNVGIGTTSPAYKLHINGGNGTQLLLDTTSQYCGVDIANATSVKGGLSWDNTNAIFGLYTNGSIPMTFQTNNTERMRITSGGNVGIGSASPVGFASDDLVLQISNPTGGGSAMRSMMRFTNVNSGTAWGNGTFLGLDSTLDFYIGQLENAPIIFQTNSTERMRITSGGNVGIGTTSPGTTLDISVAEASLRLTSTTGTNFTNQRIVNTGGTLWSGIERSTGGVLGITGAYEAFLLYGADNPMYIGTGNSYLRFGTNSTERMRITSGGNVEINTGSIKTGEPDTGWGRAAIKIGASVSGTAFNVTRYLPVSVDGTVYYINLNSSTP